MPKVGSWALCQWPCSVIVALCANGVLPQMEIESCSTSIAERAAVAATREPLKDSTGNVVSVGGLFEALQLSPRRADMELAVIDKDSLRLKMEVGLVREAQYALDHPDADVDGGVEQDVRPVRDVNDRGR